VAPPAWHAEVVHRRPQPFEQQGTANHVGVVKANTALTLVEPQDRCLVRELLGIAGRCDLEHHGDALRRRRLDDEQLSAALL
jgi:hypothetical protein